jgi:hypothetical protein
MKQYEAIDMKQYEAIDSCHCRSAGTDTGDLLNRSISSIDGANRAREQDRHRLSVSARALRVPVRTKAQYNASSWQENKSKVSQEPMSMA